MDTVVKNVLQFIAINHIEITSRYETSKILDDFEINYHLNSDNEWTRELQKQMPADERPFSVSLEDIYEDAFEYPDDNSLSDLIECGNAQSAGNTETFFKRFKGIIRNHPDYNLDYAYSYYYSEPLDQYFNDDELADKDIEHFNSFLAFSHKSLPDHLFTIDIQDIPSDEKIEDISEVLLENINITVINANSIGLSAAKSAFALHTLNHLNTSKPGDSITQDFWAYVVNQPDIDIAPLQNSFMANADHGIITFALMALSSQQNSSLDKSDPDSLPGYIGLKPGQKLKGTINTDNILGSDLAIIHEDGLVIPFKMIDVLRCSRPIDRNIEIDGNRLGLYAIQEFIQKGNLIIDLERQLDTEIELTQEELKP